ncbi:hypothetical protein E2C01_081112 [Portunus trituberculatus]|uniref:Uncharacterized protein n=1 Tax=Portunus trituberculatus TaxID=210409 RepID=A0A5B7IVR9_PORTR|nr:hypothetical protein [Portunus trituberculatus]
MLEGHPVMAVQLYCTKNVHSSSTLTWYSVHWLKAESCHCCHLTHPPILSHPHLFQRRLRLNLESGTPEYFPWQQSDQE